MGCDLPPHGDSRPPMGLMEQRDTGEFSAGTHEKRLDKWGLEDWAASRPILQAPLVSHLSLDYTRACGRIKLPIRNQTSYQAGLHSSLWENQTSYQANFLSGGQFSFARAALITLWRAKNDSYQFSNL